jgi:hypothetical protein
MEEHQLQLFGKISNQVIERRKNNPELVYIENVHNCIIEEIGRDHLLNLYSGGNKKKNINKFLKKTITRCYRDGLIHLKSTKALYLGDSLNTKDRVYINSDFGTGDFSNQSLVTYKIANHDLFINEYRYNDWQKKTSKIL